MIWSHWAYLYSKQLNPFFDVVIKNITTENTYSHLVASCGAASKKSKSVRPAAVVMSLLDDSSSDEKQLLVQVRPSSGLGGLNLDLCHRAGMQYIINVCLFICSCYCSDKNATSQVLFNSLALKNIKFLHWAAILKISSSICIKFNGTKKIRKFCCRDINWLPAENSNYWLDFLSSRDYF